MLLPPSIKIGIHTFEVKLSEDLGDECMGEMCDIANTIKISKPVTRSRKLETFFHECLHAMLSGHTFRDEERILVILGQSLTQFISDNPTFMTDAVEYLSDPKKTLS